MEPIDAYLANYKSLHSRIPPATRTLIDRYYSTSSMIKYYEQQLKNIKANMALLSPHCEFPVLEGKDMEQYLTILHDKYRISSSAKKYTEMEQCLQDYQATLAEIKCNLSAVGML